jgi:hypothetical protein
MRNLLRKPLPWMVLAECSIVVALIMVAWHMITSPPVQAVLGVPAASPPAQAGESMGPVSTGVTVQPSSTIPALLPGLNVDPNFWRLRLVQLNRGETSFELLEWRLVHALMDAAHRYVESVVMPSIAQAERRR